MSVSGDSKADFQEREALARLDKAVGKLLDERIALLGRVGELEALLDRMRKGKADPVELQSRLSRMESENRELKGRIEEGREGIDRLLSRLRFLENQR
jgi:chromosome segregation ATPase